MNLAIASDHAGFKLKEFLLKNLSGFHINDFGTNCEKSVDYPDYVKKLAKYIETAQAKFGILICGSGIGISIASNRYKHIRAALCLNKEMAILARKHNDANVICLGARFTENNQALEYVLDFINTDFEAGRHQIRINKINEDL